jgi:hypothetical protein
MTLASSDEQLATLLESSQNKVLQMSVHNSLLVGQITKKS